MKTWLLLCGFMLLGSWFTLGEARAEGHYFMLETTDMGSSLSSGMNVSPKMTIGLFLERGMDADSSVYGFVRSPDVGLNVGVRAFAIGYGIEAAYFLNPNRSGPFVGVRLGAVEETVSFNGVSGLTGSVSADSAVRFMGELKVGYSLKLIEWLHLVPAVHGQLRPQSKAFNAQVGLGLGVALLL